MKFSQALFGGGKGFLFFAESEADLRGAVACVVVEAGARDNSNANFFDEVSGEGDIVRFRAGASEMREVEPRNIRHDVVRASRLEDSEASAREDFQEAFALGGVSGSELVVVAPRKVQCACAGLLQRSGSADRQEIMDLANRLYGPRRRQNPSHSPSGDAVGFRQTVDDDGAVA